MILWLFILRYGSWRGRSRWDGVGGGSSGGGSGDRGGGRAGAALVVGLVISCCSASRTFW